MMAAITSGNPRLNIMLLKNKEFQLSKMYHTFPIDTDYLCSVI